MGVTMLPAASAQTTGLEPRQDIAMTRRGPATETLWMNYDAAAIDVDDVAYVGRDFRERERIKRKAKRWAARFHAMQRCEQLAILAELGVPAAPSETAVGSHRHG